ncbi:MAG: MFS transporter [Actinomycetia bacterium]|nr:MFS transporter [Actinomycetes bacterium]
MSDRSADEAGPYRRVLANAEARGLLVAQGASEVGDQVARVAIALLVLERTDSAFYAALALAVAYLPGIAGVAVLGSLADRYPRRALLLRCDLGRAVVIGLLAVLALLDSPLWAIFGLLFLNELLVAPFGAARASLYPEVLPDPSTYVAAQGLSRTIHLATQVLGAIVGAAVVGLIGVPMALALDALTFLVSFAIIRARVQPRPVADVPGTSLRRLVGDLGDGARELLGDPVRRALALLGWGSALFLVAPEAVALAYRPGLPEVVGGALLAAVPAGSAVGAFLLPRVPLREQVRLLLPLAAASCLPLFATSVDPPPAVAAALWFLAGLLQAYVLTVIAVITVVTSRARRGRVLGVASSGFSAATALSFALVGWLATLPSVGPARAVSLAGAAGLVMVAVLRALWPTEALDRLF